MITDKCKYCGKEIEGWTDKHVDYMLTAHIKAKHPEKIRGDLG